MRSSLQVDFSRRESPRELPELMDDECTYETFRACLRSLKQVNRLSLGYRPTLIWLNHITYKSHEPLHIVDVGSGGGDLLRRIARWPQSRAVAVHLTGVDLNPHAARAAFESTPKDIDISWVTCDALTYQPERPIDFIISSLTTHHLEDDAIVDFLKWIELNARAGWFINDLERSGRTSRMFGRMAELMRWHRFVRHDGRPVLSASISAG